MLRRVADEIVALLTDSFDRGDPVVGRLFPDVYPDDPQDSAEYRRYTEGDLKTAKIDQAGAILAALPPRGGGTVRLDAEEAETWLRAINDVRLAMAVRLEITDGTDIEEELGRGGSGRPRLQPGSASSPSTPTSATCRSRCWRR